MPIRSRMSSIMGPIEREHPELFALECGKIAAYDSVSSPEHNVLRVNFCDRSLSGVRPSGRVSIRPSVNNYFKNLLI